jgi:hypothetical protein
MNDAHSAAAMNEPPTDAAARSRRIRRNALVLGLVALGFYVAFILMAVSGVRL